MSSQALQIAAGIVVVSAFAGLQLKLLDPFGVPYLAMNLLSTGALAVAAVSVEQYGFLLTNGTWALVSLLGLLRLAQLGPLAPGRRRG